MKTDEVLHKALHGEDEQTYYDMFDSIQSDDVVKALRLLHQTTGSVESVKSLILLLDKMLVDHLIKEIENVSE